MSDSPAPDGVDVAVAVPHRGDVSMRWAVRLATLQMPPHVIVTQSTAAIDRARELTVEEALKHEPEWVLFLDSDVIPPVDAFGRLTSHGVDVVSGVYYMDREEIHPATWRVGDDEVPRVVDPNPDGALATVDAVGLGCLLVRREALEALERPWFRWSRGFEEHPWDLQSLGERPGVSEDFYFCHKLREAGYEIHVDTAVQCLHEKGCLLSNEGVFLESQLNPRE